MTFNAPKTALALQFAYPVLIVLYNVMAFPAIHADAQRFQGPPYYLPAMFFISILCVSLLVAEFLLWKRTLIGWLLSVFTNGGVALFLTYVAVIDHLEKFPMLLAQEFITAGIGMLFSVIPILLVYRSSLIFLGVIDPPIPNPA